MARSTNKDKTEKVEQTKPQEQQAVAPESSEHGVLDVIKAAIGLDTSKTDSEAPVEQPTQLPQGLKKFDKFKKGDTQHD